MREKEAPQVAGLNELVVGGTEPRLRKGHMQRRANLGATEHVMLRDPRHSHSVPFGKAAAAERARPAGIAHPADRTPQWFSGIEGNPLWSHQYSSASMIVRTR